MNIFFASDLHFAHKNIVKMGKGFRPGKDSEEHDEILIENWNKKIAPKRTRTYVLGDISMSAEGIKKIERLNGEIRIILGNHDIEWSRDDLPANVTVMNTSLFRYKKMWLSHCPIHPMEMRKCLANVHGHIHLFDVDDPRYMNVCIERLPGFAPISLEELWTEFDNRGITELRRNKKPNRKENE